MSKYIDADKLIARIKRKIESIENCPFQLASFGEEKKSEGELIAYKDALSLIDSLQQEQPEVDLDKFTEKIKTFQGKYKHPEIVSIKGAMAFMARMFYQYPNVARQWYDSLPKATMDDAIKEE